MTFGFVVARARTLFDPFEPLFQRLPERVFFTRFIPRLVCLRDVRKVLKTGRISREKGPPPFFPGRNVRPRHRPGTSTF